MGLPSQVANGTNRIAIVLQSFVGTAGYRSKGVSTYPFNVYLGIAAFFGSLIGAQIAVDIAGAVFNRILSIIMLSWWLLLFLNQRPKILTYQND